MSLPNYSKSLNTKPRISSPLTSELKFNSIDPFDHLRDCEDPLPQPSSPASYKASLGFLILIDSLVFLQLARFLSPYLSLHLESILPYTSNIFQECALNLNNIPHGFIISTIAIIKSISGTCLLNTGTTSLSYLVRNTIVYTLLTALILVPSPSPLLSILITLVLMVMGMITICLPLLRLVQVLLDLEDQQSVQNRHPQYQLNQHKSLQPSTNHHPHVKRASRIYRHPKLLQARYQHLMNPF